MGKTGVMTTLDEGERPEALPEVGLLADLVEAPRSIDAEMIVERSIGALADALDDVGVTNAVRKKLLKVAGDRLSILERYLDDPMVSADKRVRMLAKVLEIAIRVPAAAIEAEGKGTTFRVTVGGNR